MIIKIIGLSLFTFAAMNFELWSQQLEEFLRSYRLESSELYLSHFVLTVLGLVVVSFLIWLLMRLMIGVGVRILIKNRKSELRTRLAEQKVFRAWSFVVIAWMLNAAFPYMFIGYPKLAAFMIILIEVLIVASFLYALNATMNVIVGRLESTERYSDKPIRSYKQVITIVLFIVGFVLILAILIGKSPLYILGGFGAITAILLLIFRDAILGFVASIQMSAMDLVRIGDWIAMDKYGADGTVTEINLTTVKVRNWDMTYTLIPSYALVSESFKNWRGMYESEGRRIKRHISINISSIKFVDEALYKKLLHLERIRDLIISRQREIDLHNTHGNINRDVLLNGRHMTNIGVFRLYAETYISNNPKINTEMSFMVRQLQPTETGIPLEIYAFSKDQRWVNYESLAADIFDHLLAAIPYFELEVFQSPSGSDMRTLSDISDDK